MSIKTELKKEEIEVIRPLDTLTINSIARMVAEKLIRAFPNQNLSYDELFIRLSRLNMYVAKFPKGLAKAKYFHRNTSIYFEESLDFNTIDLYAMHECIHYLQESRDVKGNLIQLGLCNFTNSNLPGMALNEAAVQLATTKALGQCSDTVKYYDITFPTPSPSHYALQCNLLTQMTYITGPYSLYHSMFYSDDLFKNKFISLTSKKVYQTIQTNMDLLLTLEDELSQKTANLETLEASDRILSKLSSEIHKIRTRIKELFFATQNMILTSYFDLNYTNIYTLHQIEDYRKKLYNYKDLIGTAQEYSFFNHYYIDKMAALETKTQQLKKHAPSYEEDLSLVPIKHHFFLTFIQKLKKLFFMNTKSEEENPNLI